MARPLRHLTTPLGAFLFALAVRVVMMVALDLPRPIRNDPTWDWAYEQGAVAQSLVRGEGYASPFRRQQGVFTTSTGSTAWCGPVFPALLAGAIEATDGIDRSTQLLVAGAHVLLSGAIGALLVVFGRSIGRPRLAAVAGLFWGVHPLAGYYALMVVWDSVLVAFLLMLALTLLVRAGPLAAPHRLVVPGLAFGLVGLVNPAPLAIAPAIALYLFRDRIGFDGARAVALYGFCALLVVLPWSVRNQLVLGTPNLKANLGVEMMVGNNGDEGNRADGAFSAWIHPAYNARQFDLYHSMGEAEYGRYAMQQARAWIGRNPQEFAKLSLVRARLFWAGWSPLEPEPLRSGSSRSRDLQGWLKWATHFVTGMAAILGFACWRDPRRAGVLVRGVLVLFPLVYYVTHVLERYRMPIEPFVVLAASAALLRVHDRWQRSRATPTREA